MTRWAWLEPSPPYPIAWWIIWILAGEQAYRSECYGDALEDYAR